MSRVRAFFLREGAECLAGIREEVGKPVMDVAAVYRSIRRFRGSAQMARLGALADRALRLEERLRPSQAGSSAMPVADDPLRREVGEVLESLEIDMEAVREGRFEEDPRMEAGMQEQEAGGTEGRNVVPIDTLEYRGSAALDRALELRAALETAIVQDQPAGPILDELFDLIRLART